MHSIRTLKDVQTRYGSPRRPDGTLGTTSSPSLDTLAGALPGGWNFRMPARKGGRPAARNLFSDESLEDWQDVEDADLDANAESRQRTEDIEARVDRVFRQAGTTLGPLSSTQVPLLVFSPCHLPTASDDITTQEVLDRLLVRIEPYVNGSYVAILFAAPTAESMSMATILSLYNSLSRTAKKNLERLYIVHPPFWTRLIIRAFLSTIVSAQVAKKRKVQIISSLSELRSALDISSVEIPQPVVTLNATIEPSLGPVDAATQQFGIPLSESGLPRVVTDCTRVLLSTDALLTVGLMRIPASKATVTLLRHLYDHGHPVSLEQWTPEPAHLAASLLKSFIGSLPSPIFSSDVYFLIERCPAADNEALSYILDRILPTLSIPQRQLLNSFIQVLHEISLRSEDNNMDAHALAVCAVPVLLRSSDVVRDAKHCQVGGGKSMSGGPSETTTGMTSLGTVIRIMITHYADLFETPSSSDSLSSPTQGSATTEADEAATPPQSPSQQRRPLRSRQSTDSSFLRSPTRRRNSDLAPSIRLENGKATISIRKGAIVAAQSDNLEAAGLLVVD